jgi:catechol 2,3-dioxygenase-like lactoylglutathione lyase family enzyme
MIRVQQIDHATFVVRDLEATRRFYVDNLGLEQVPRPAFDFAGLWFRAGSTLLHVILEHDRSGRAGVNEDGRVKSTRGFHLAFAVADAEVAAAELEAAGVTFVTKPKLRPDGAVQTFVLDPDGHVIELSSPPKRDARVRQ